MVGRTVHQYIQAGVAAFHLEDQVVNKRCGHLRNKEIVDEDVYLTRIRAAVNARSEAETDIVIIARTDALQSLGYEKAVERLKAAIAVGADVAFLEGFTSKEQARKVCLELAPTPVLLNMVSGGVTPNFTVQEAQDVGFRVIIFPGFALSPAYKYIAMAAKKLRETGNLAEADGETEEEFSPKALFMAVGLKKAMEFDLAAGGKMYENGV
jgi:2-methylisocitrate lyase-like PEP mutase family enzyme